MINWKCAISKYAQNQDGWSGVYENRKKSKKIYTEGPDTTKTKTETRKHEDRATGKEENTGLFHPNPWNVFENPKGGHNSPMVFPKKFQNQMKMPGPMISNNLLFDDN